MITFFKCKSGIYKKASELATLTNDDVGVIVFSPSRKPYFFGCPSIEAVSNRLQRVNLPLYDSNLSIIEAQCQMRIARLNQHQNDLLHQIDAEKDLGKILKEFCHLF
ncbi:hypothetical protein Q3G72_022704 [Acer saccharum]|nr:hypothetical protein Q3G72_022704 [Acer saccharum]